MNLTNTANSNKTLDDFNIGDRVTLLPARYSWDYFSGEYYVVGKVAPSDLQLARNPGDTWEVMVHLSRVTG